ncbi:uncharacterized protein J3R85_010876 [Psidium guajava]|nr:uncharacterized protein J3R85_010876 [Psidium guajava]
MGSGSYSLISKSTPDNVCRLLRGASGHPTGGIPLRECVQLFVPHYLKRESWAS